MRRFILLFALLLLASLPRSIAVAQDATPPANAASTPSADATFHLLTEAQVPEGLVIIQDGTRTLDDVTAGFGDPEAAREQFTEWGWQRNLVRAFHAPEGATTDPARIDGVYLSVHEFASAESAAAALDYSFEAHAAGTDLEDLPDPRLGDSSRALYGSMPYGNEITLYVQEGTVLIRLSASSPEGDPQAETVEMMTAILGPQQATPAATP